MGLFGKDKTTVSDKDMADLRRRAEKANTESMFSKRNVEKRKATSDQKSKSRWS